MTTKLQTQENAPWLGSFPNDWIFRRGKFFFRSGKEINSDLDCDNVLSLTMGGVVHRGELGEGGLLPASYETFQVFYPNDLVFKLIDLENYKTSRVGLVPEKGIMSSAYVRLVPIDESIIYPKFAYHFYYNLYLQGIYNFLGMGVRSTLAPWNLLEIPILLPPIETQKRIADFLDEKTRVIDELIAKKENLIELLREKRAALITRAVTKGLNPNVKLKPSGVDWLGDIPEGWGVKPLKFLFSYQAGGIWGEEERFDENDMICIRVADFDFLSFATHSDEYTRRNLPEIKKSFLLDERSVLLEKSGGGDQSPVGRAVRYVGSEKATCSNFIQKLEVNSGFNREFVVYLLATLYFLGVTRKAIKQTTGIQNLDLGYFFRTPVFYPPTDEQKKIAQHINIELEKIVDTLEKVESQIEKLKEYRSSLIYHAVTGRIKI